MSKLYLHKTYTGPRHRSKSQESYDESNHYLLLPRCFRATAFSKMWSFVASSLSRLPWSRGRFIGHANCCEKPQKGPEKGSKKASNLGIDTVSDMHLGVVSLEAIPSWFMHHDECIAHHNLARFTTGFVNGSGAVSRVSLNQHSMSRILKCKYQQRGIMLRGRVLEKIQPSVNHQCWLINTPQNANGRKFPYSVICVNFNKWWRRYGLLYLF